MKLTVIGFGQCGGRIADQFSRINTRARRQRGIEIVPAVFAVNTDTADLSGLSYVPRDNYHRILIGGRSTGGHGIGKLNELAVGIARQESDRVFHAIRESARAFESDAFLLVSSGAGGTGSGSISVMATLLKERYLDRPIYALIALPFEYEERTEERSTYNTALCLKSVNSVADATILVDNQRYVGKGSTLGSNFTDINSLIVEPFYDILCAGEERKKKHIGAKTLDASDIIATLSGWTVIGYGSSAVNAFNLPFRRSDFIKKSSQTMKGIQAMDKAVSDLSLACSPVQARRALYLLTGPTHDLNTDLAQEVGQYLRGLLPKATIRNGDYPREKSLIGVNVILSEIASVDKVKEYYSRSVSLIPQLKTRREESLSSLEEMESVGKDLPSLL